MADAAQTDAAAAPQFYFSAHFGDGQAARFQEVEVRNIGLQQIEYRHGNNPIFYPIKMPGLGRVGNVTMRKGIFINDSKFWSWYNEDEANATERRSVVIHLLDETGVPQRTWTLNNAWPTKVTGTELKGEGNEVAVESVEIAFETLIISAP